MVAVATARVATAMVAEEAVEAVVTGQAAQVEDRMAGTVEEEREVGGMVVAMPVGRQAEALQEVARMVVAAVVDMGAEARAVVVMAAA